MNVNAGVYVRQIVQLGIVDEIVAASTRLMFSYFVDDDNMKVIIVHFNDEK
jgi:hypothetical protein